MDSHAVLSLRNSWKAIDWHSHMLFMLQRYYMLGRFRQEDNMWKILDQSIAVARALGTPEAAAILVLALAWKSYAILKYTMKGGIIDPDFVRQGRQALSEMLSVFDQMLLSDLVCAEVTMAIGFWQEWQACALPGSSQACNDCSVQVRQAEKQISRALEHYSAIDFLEEFANDGLRLCRIKLVVDSLEAEVQAKEKIRKQMCSHLLAVRNKGMIRLNIRTSLRCLATVMELSEPHAGSSFGLGCLIAGHCPSSHAEHVP